MRVVARTIAKDSAPASPLGGRIAALDWERIGTELDASGSATTGVMLTPEECAELASGYDDAHAFRSRVVMARHGFGRGEYKYYAYALPEPVATLRGALYPHLAAIANRWEAALGRPGDYPTRHEAYLERCHAAGQKRPTPLLLRYGRATTTASTRIFTARSPSRCRWPSC